MDLYAVCEHFSVGYRQAACFQHYIIKSVRPRSKTCCNLDVMTCSWLELCQTKRVSMLLPYYLLLRLRIRAVPVVTGVRTSGAAGLHIGCTAVL
jgi:hypothetical protein